MSATPLAITGANGFVGSALSQFLATREIPHRPLCRIASSNQSVDSCTVDFGSSVSIRDSLKGCSTLIHLIARTHSAETANLFEEYRDINVRLTARIAQAAAEAGVRRIVYLSSIKVNGEVTTKRPFTSEDIPRPEGPYGASKLEAENLLRNFCQDSGMELVILRIPLVYAPHASGNIATLRKALQRGVPLPLASLRNRRSILELNRLCEILLACAESHSAAGKILLSCSETITTPDLVRKLARDTDTQARLVGFSPALLAMLARLAGKRNAWQKLSTDLEMKDNTAAFLDLPARPQP